VNAKFIVGVEVELDRVIVFTYVVKVAEVVVWVTPAVVQVAVKV
jgi:hypothetical protein